MLLVVFLLALVSATMDMVWPLAIKRVIDDVLLAGGVDNAEKFRRLNVFGGAIVGLLVLKEIVETYRGYRTSLLNSKVVFLSARSSSTGSSTCRWESSGR